MLSSPTWWYARSGEIGNDIKLKNTFTYFWRSSRGPDGHGRLDYSRSGLAGALEGGPPVSGPRVRGSDVRFVLVTNNNFLILVTNFFLKDF